ncbi:hypothetical protein ABFS83_13G171100 [Erythranthe nasuta]
MAKHAIFAGFLVALIAVGSAATSTYTTVEEENPSCQREIKEMPMKECIKWIQSELGGGRSTFPRSAVANPGQEHLEECCDEFRRVSSPCRCEAVEHMTRQMQQQYGTEETQETIRERMQSLPRTCNIRSPTRCRSPAAVFV